MVTRKADARARATSRISPVWHGKCTIIEVSAPSDVFGAAHGRWYASVHVHSQRERIMLMTIVVVLVVLWLLGMVTATTMGGLVHVLLVLAVIVVLVRVIQGRRVI